jgi:hypothetical protein
VLVPELPSLDELTVRTVAGMREAVQKLRAKAESEARELEQQINDLLMLGYEGAKEHLK